MLGSVEGQDVFNPLKGSIPARVDADVNKYDEYGKQTIEDFKNNRLTPSWAHGSAAAEGFLTEANKIINTFVTQGDVDQGRGALNRRPHPAGSESEKGSFRLSAGVSACLRSSRGGCDARWRCNVPLSTI